ADGRPAVQRARRDVVPRGAEAAVQAVSGDLERPRVVVLRQQIGAAVDERFQARNFGHPRCCVKAVRLYSQPERLKPTNMPTLSTSIDATMVKNAHSIDWPGSPPRFIPQIAASRLGTAMIAAQPASLRM